MTLVCSSCKREFKNNQGLTKHWNTCKESLTDLTRILHRREEREDHEQPAKIPRIEAEDVDMESHEPGDPEEDVDMVIVVGISFDKFSY